MIDDLVKRLKLLSDPIGLQAADHIRTQADQVTDFWATIETLRQELAAKDARIRKLERIVKVLIDDDNGLGRKDE